MASVRLYEVDWQPGDLVWAKYSGWPWWPAVVLNERSGSIHVIFVDSPVSHAWVHAA